MSLLKGGERPTGQAATLRPAAVADLPAILALLRAASLPTDDLAGSLVGFVVAEDRGHLVAAGGLEQCGDSALLRSVVVAPPARGQGLGMRIVARLLQQGRDAGLGTLWLLTDTAMEFFPRFGFRPVRRDQAPPAIRETAEFAHACPASAVAMARRVAPFRVLVLCTANSARSQIAEALLRHRGGDLVHAGSAGTRPGPGPHPQAVEALAELGIDWRGRRSTSIDAMGHDWDLVITVCDDAREACPVLPGHATLHWGLPDPAAVQGSDAERLAAFTATAHELDRRIAGLLALPLAVMSAGEVAGALRH